MHRLCENDEQLWKGLDRPRDLVSEVGSCSQCCIDIRGCLYFWPLYAKIFPNDSIFWSLEISRLLFSGFYPRYEEDMDEKRYILEYVTEKRTTMAEITMHLKNTTHKVANDQRVFVPHTTGVPRNEPGRGRPLGNPRAGERGWMWMQWKSLAQSPKASRGQEGYFRGTQVLLHFS